MAMGNEELMRKAELATADLTTNGGELAPDKFDQFVARATVASKFLSEARVTSQKSTTDVIPKLRFTGRVAYRATEGTALTLAQRTAPATSEVSITTDEFVAELPLTDSVLEDNVARGSLADLIEMEMPKRIGRDTQLNFIQGDTTSADYDLAAFDGIRAATTTNTVNAASARLSLAHIASARLALPEEFRNDLTTLRLMVGDTVEVNYRQDLAARATGYGDAVLQGNDPLTQLGIRMMVIPEWPVTLAPGNLSDGILTDPKNWIISFWRKVTMETERSARARKTTWIWSYRVGGDYEEEEAAVKIQNILAA